MSDTTAKQEVQLDPSVDFLAGTVAGLTALIVGFPFDTVKVRFQNASTSVRYKSTFHALSTILREERVRGLYKGISTPLVTAPLMNGLVFSTYRFFMKLQTRHDGRPPTVAQVALGGAACGVAASLLTTPIELIKIQQQQALLRSPTVPPAQTVAWNIFKQRGVRGLYRGIAATALRDTGYGAYFAGYEAALHFFKPSRPPPPATADHIHDEVSESLTHAWWHLLLAGGFAGIAGWGATFPFDVVKTRMQGNLDGGPAPARPYRSTLSTIAHSYRTEGPGVFFHGLAPTLIRAIPVNMVVFGTFEGVVYLFS
ncbi:mitochondrial carrier [Auriscalpium vulgare]|uniref:Mitochondrial carrier n=1 Tax=Auriscalpium vulgare TaxID=40419 RepID=A0ACB8RUE8_9AGAM|nr:mitochondrial carrier [Auriscalpium vulgare]